MAHTDSLLDGLTELELEGEGEWSDYFSEIAQDLCSLYDESDPADEYFGGLDNHLDYGLASDLDLDDQCERFFAGLARR